MSPVSRVALLTAAAVVSIPSVSLADDASCKPRVVQSATDAQLQRSSGYRLLDRSAARSIVDGWLFDVSSCASATLPAQHLVAVQFQNDEY